MNRRLDGMHRGGGGEKSILYLFESGKSTTDLAACRDYYRNEHERC